MLLMYQILCVLLFGVVYVTCGSNKCLSQPDYQLQGYEYSRAAVRGTSQKQLDQLRLGRSSIDVTGMLSRLKKYCYRSNIRSGTARHDDYSSDPYTEPQKGKWVVTSLCDSNPTSTTFKGKWVDGCYLYPEWRNWKCPYVKCNPKLCNGITSPNKYTWFVCQPDSYYYIDLLVACPKNGKWFLTTKRAWFPRCCGCKKYSWQCV
uniref:Foot protein 17 n=1 Tax=Mytilus californianus TaxID=6549 RepID=A0A223HCQ3_MYTCA|nr:foot protein 17 [Mytilus californianus]